MSEFNLKNSRIAIVGLGLMGGSLGLALIKNQVCREVVGLVRRQEAITEALELGVVHAATLDPAEALQFADLVVFSTPIRTIMWQIDEYSAYYKSGAIITDMGSTKQEIVRVMARLPDDVHPVGSHPMCGKERAGMSAAEAGLYRDAPWIVTPLSRSNPEAAETVQQMARSIGAQPLILTPHRHDKLVATISHLPYTLAASLVLAAQTIAADDPAVWDVAASGFRDTSRVAASDVTMMLDILLTNQGAVTQLIALARQQLDQFALAIADGDEAGLRELMEQAARQRRVMYQ
jgi:prephenate dehydrogenase